VQTQTNVDPTIVTETLTKTADIVGSLGSFVHQ